MCGIDGTLFPGQEKAGTALRFKFIGALFPKVALTGNLGLEGATALRFDRMHSISQGSPAAQPWAGGRNRVAVR